MIRSFVLPMIRKQSHWLFSAALVPATVSAGSKSVEFPLLPNPAFWNCLSDGSGEAPSAQVKVTAGKDNDRMVVQLKHIKPGLAFDLFTIERSNLLPNGSPDGNFQGFGLAWYQSDVEADSQGNATVQVKTILLNQIFGFDSSADLAPTNTFHVGIWFNDPKDAVPCGFDANNPTPFNGEHRAGPLAMITVPKANTGLGPLCTKPNKSTFPATCNP